jgi:hypothetical protein
MILEELELTIEELFLIRGGLCPEDDPPPPPPPPGPGEDD